MEPSAFSQLYVVFLVLFGFVRGVVSRLGELLWAGVVLAILGVGYLYASVAVRIKEFLSRPGPKLKFNRTL